MIDNPDVLRGCLQVGAAAVGGAATTFVTYAVCRKLVGLARWDVRLLSLVVLGIWIANVLFHVLLSASLFRPVPALALLVGCAVAIERSGYRLSTFVVDLGTDVRHWVRIVHGAWFALGPFGGTALSAVVLWFGWRSLLTVPMGWDTLTYHGTKAGLWVQAGGPIRLAAPGGWAIYKHYFGGGEMLMAWAMMPFGSDVVAGVLDWIGWVLFGLALWVLGREFRIRPKLLIPSVFFLMTVPAVYRAVGSGYVDNILHALLVAGLAFAIRCRRTGNESCLVLCAASLGLTATVKVTGAVSACLLVAGLATLEIWRPRLSIRWPSGWMLAAAAFGLAWGPWLALNYAESGAPLGTTPVEVFGIGLGRLTPEMSWYLDHPELAPYSLAAEAAALQSVIGGIRSHMPILGVLCVPLVVGGCLQLPTLSRRNPDATILTAIVALACLASIYQPSFSVVRLLWADSAARFFVPAIVVGVLWLAGGAGHRGWSRDLLPAYLWGAGALHLTAILDGIGWRLIPALMVLTVSSFAAVLALRQAHDRRWSIIAAIASSGLLVFGVPLLESWKVMHRHELLSENYALHDIERQWLPVLRHVERLEPARIAFTNGPRQSQDHQFLYPLLGSRLQHDLVYVPTTESGIILPHDGPSLRLREKSAGKWVERLIDCGVTHVMSFGPATAELSWMEEQPHFFRRLEGDGSNWGFYAVMFPS